MRDPERGSFRFSRHMILFEAYPMFTRVLAYIFAESSKAFQSKPGLWVSITPTRKTYLHAAHRKYDPSHAPKLAKKIRGSIRSGE